MYHVTFVGAALPATVVYFEFDDGLYVEFDDGLYVEFDDGFGARAYRTTHDLCLSSAAGLQTELFNVPVLFDDSPDFWGPIEIVNTAFTFPQKTLTGKVALIKAGGVGLNGGGLNDDYGFLEHSMIRRYAHQAGALAVIIVGPADQGVDEELQGPRFYYSPITTDDEDEEEDRMLLLLFPAVSISVDDGDAIIEAINGGMLRNRQYLPLAGLLCICEIQIYPLHI